MADYMNIILIRFGERQYSKEKLVPNQFPDPTILKMPNNLFHENSINSKLLTLTFYRKNFKSETSDFSMK